MTDEDTSYVISRGADKWQILQVGCQGPQWGIYVGMAAFHGKERSVVVYRFDSEPATEGEVWKADREEQGYYVPSDLMPQFLEKLKAASRLAVQARKYDGGSITAVFDLAGSSKAISKLSCLQN